MIVRQSLVVLSAWIAIAALGGPALAQGFGWGAGPWWSVPYPFDYRGYEAGRIPTPPYFAIHPPVYFGQRVGMPYGNSPVTRPPRAVEDDRTIRLAPAPQAAAPQLIANPFVQLASAANGEPLAVREPAAGKQRDPAAEQEERKEPLDEAARELDQRAADLALRERELAAEKKRLSADQKRVADQEKLLDKEWLEAATLREELVEERTRLAVLRERLHGEQQRLAERTAALDGQQAVLGELVCRIAPPRDASGALPSRGRAEQQPARNVGNSRGVESPPANEDRSRSPAPSREQDRNQEQAPGKLDHFWNRAREAAEEARRYLGEFGSRPAERRQRDAARPLK